MSRTDHHNATARTSRHDFANVRGNVFAVVRKHHLRPSANAEIQAALLDNAHTDGHVTTPGLKEIAKTARYSNGVPMATCGLAEWECSLLHSWREALLSDCDYGCKVYQRIHDGVRETQIQHMSAYGCKDTDEPIERHETVRTRQAVPPMIRRYMPTTRPVTTTFTRKELSSRTNGVVMTEAPSLMQMARARQAQLNGGR